MATLSVIVPFVLNDTITLAFTYKKDDTDQTYKEEFKSCHLYKKLDVSDEIEE